MQECTGKRLGMAKWAKNVIHRINPKISEVFRSYQPRDVGKMKSPNKTHVVRIALTGGPCAGKSSSVETIVKKSRKHGFDVVIAPEMPTLIFNSGIQMPEEPNERFTFAFQSSNVALQLQLERSLTNICACTNRPTILVYDRGIMDSKAYIDKDGWQNVLKYIDDHHATRKFDEDYILERYDGVVHLETAAKGAEDFYKNGWTKDDMGKKVFRKETIEEAREMDDIMIDCWKNHKKHFIVGNLSHNTFEDKLDAVSDCILKIAESKHPK